MDLTFNVKRINIEGYQYKEIRLEIEGADISDILYHFTLKDIISHFGEDQVLEHIGEVAAADYFDWKETE